MLYIRLNDDSVFKFSKSDIEDLRCSSDWILVTISHCVQDITVYSQFHFPFGSIVEFRFFD